jgi:hypothetical protein
MTVGHDCATSIGRGETPWEILLKTFRDELTDKSFNSLEGYAEEFFTFLDGNARLFPEDVQKQNIASAAERAAYQTVFDVVDALDKLENDPAAATQLRDAIAGDHFWGSAGAL